jgi:hypothetical protein
MMILRVRVDNEIYKLTKQWIKIYDKLNPPYHISDEQWRRNLEEKYNKWGEFADKHKLYKYETDANARQGIGVGNKNALEYTYLFGRQENTEKLDKIYAVYKLLNLIKEVDDETIK